MPEKNPYEQLFQQISEVLKLIQDNEGKKFDGPLPPDIHQRLDEIENYILILKEFSDKAFAKSGVSESEVKKMIAEAPTEASRPQVKRLFQMAERLKNDIQKKEIDYSIATGRKKKGLSETDSGKKAQQRKKKFKKLGGDHWMPL